MDLRNNETISEIEKYIKLILTHDSVNKHDIALILVLLTEIIDKRFTVTELEDCIICLHEYILKHYDTFENSEHYKEFNEMLTLCSKLLLYQPRIKKKCFNFNIKFNFKFKFNFKSFPCFKN
jgi:hypothetical protein